MRQWHPTDLVMWPIALFVCAVLAAMLLGLVVG